MDLVTHNSSVKCIKNIVILWYIITLNMNSLFVLKRHNKTLKDTCIEANIQAQAITWLSISTLLLSANLFSWT